MADTPQQGEKTPSTDGEERKAQPGKGRTWRVYAMVLPALAAVAFALVLFVLKPLFPPLDAEDGKEAKVSVGTVVSLNSVIVNLAESKGRRYLKARVEIEVAGDEESVQEAEERKPHLLDLLIDLLSRKRVEEVTSTEGRDRLRGEIRERFSRELGADKLLRVLITEFVIQ